jgi:hypothetical protein
MREVERLDSVLRELVAYPTAGQRVRRVRITAEDELEAAYWSAALYQGEPTDGV